MATSGPSAHLLRDWVTGSLVLTGRAVAALSHNGPDVAAPPLDADKVVGEALLLLRATASVGAGEHDPAWRRLYLAVEPLARPDSLAAALCLDPATALESAFGHIQLSALGNRDPGLDLLLELALAEPGCGPEQYVVGALHRAWLRGVHLGCPDLPEVESLLERSSLGRAVDVLRCTTQDVYDLSHAVMHGTDLGAWQVRVPRPVTALLADLDGLLGIALDAGERGNLDLATELLWSWPMLGLPQTPAARLALEVLADAGREHGFLPGPGFDSEVRDTLTPEAADSYVLRTSYHATLVLGILAASMLAAGDQPDELTTACAVDGSAARLLEHLGSPARAWRRVTPTDADGLAHVLLTVALRRAADRSDLPALRDLLEARPRPGPRRRPCRRPGRLPAAAQRGPGAESCDSARGELNPRTISACAGLGATSSPTCGSRSPCSSAPSSPSSCRRL